MLQPVGTFATQVQQPSAPAALIVNEGPGTLYLDKHSGVSPSQYSLRCVAGQSVNWGGGELWAVSDTGTTMTLMHGGDTTVTPVSNVTIADPVEVSGVVAVAGNVAIDGPVTIAGTVPITGDVGITGPVTVSGDVNINGTVPITGDVGIDGPVSISGVVDIGSVTGNVNVDGSTVNIGNNVRLWGGGDYLGTYTWTNVTAGATLWRNLITTFPTIVTDKYAGVYIEMSAFYTGSPTHDGFYGTLFGGLYADGTYCLDWAPIATYEIQTGAFTSYRKASIYVPIINSTAMYAGITFERFGGAPYTITMAVYGAYSTVPKQISDLNSGIIPLISANQQWINLPYPYPFRLYLAVAPGSAQAGAIARTVTSGPLGLRASMGVLAPNLNVPLIYDVYPSPKIHEQIRLDAGANSGNARYVITPL